MLYSKETYSTCATCDQANLVSYFTITTGIALNIVDMGSQDSDF